MASCHNPQTPWPPKSALTAHVQSSIPTKNKLIVLLLDCFLVVLVVVVFVATSYLLSTVLRSGTCSELHDRNGVVNNKKNNNHNHNHNHNHNNNNNTHNNNNTNTNNTTTNNNKKTLKK
ncbi:unnamed protein product [Polarella glacialis]|uniref:Uncharacterized protein n=1 Tax=Polarella glacialis TaxID=89957 RepID=A0A813LEY9_POLGL|nr:unnamed protein product [Polarella glacialis]